MSIPAKPNNIKKYSTPEQFFDEKTAELSLFDDEHTPTHLKSKRAAVKKLNLPSAPARPDFNDDHTPVTDEEKSEAQSMANTIIDDVIDYDENTDSGEAKSTSAQLPSKKIDAKIEPKIAAKSPPPPSSSVTEDSVSISQSIVEENSQVSVVSSINKSQSIASNTTRGEIKISLPKVNFPKVKLPNVKLPKLKLPKVATPEIQIFDLLSANRGVIFAALIVLFGFYLYGKVQTLRSNRPPASVQQVDEQEVSEGDTATTTLDSRFQINTKRPLVELSPQYDTWENFEQDLGRAIQNLQ